MIAKAKKKSILFFTNWFLFYSLKNVHKVIHLDFHMLPILCMERKIYAILCLFLVLVNHNLQATARKNWKKKNKHLIKSHNYIFLTSSRKLKNYHKLLLHKHDDTNSIKVAEILKFSAWKSSLSVQNLSCLHSSFFQKNVTIIHV